MSADRRPTLRRALALLVAAALLLAACDRDTDPEALLADAVDATVDTELAFELRAEADRAALEELGDAAGDAAQFLADFRVIGAREPDGAAHVSVELAPGSPVLEAVVLPDGELRLRTGLGELLGLGGSPADELDPELERRGASEQQRAALLAGYGGDWIAIPDAGGLEGALGAAGEQADTEGLDRRRLLDATEVVGATEDDDVTRLDVVVDLDRLLGEDAEVLGMSGRLPAMVEVVDGYLHRVRVELGGDLDAVDEGEVRVEVRLDEHGEASVPAPPPVAATVTIAELEELLVLLQAQ